MDVADLRALFIFDGLSDAQLAELLAAGEEVPYDTGTELFHEGDPAKAWWVLVDGSVDLVRRAGREEAVVMITMDRPGVWAGGFHAWDPSSSYLATARGAAPGRMFCVPSDALGELARKWFRFGVYLMEGFFQTVRRMDTLSRQREALIALGELAARLAHEINNPNAASARAVDALAETCDSLLSSLGRLAAESLGAEQFTALDGLRQEIVPRAISDPVAVADFENALLDWMDRHGVDNGWRIAPGLAAAGLEPAWCDRVVAAVGDGPTLEPALEWVASTLAMSTLLAEMKEATGRITTLLSAVKSYSQVDRATLQVVDVTEGIESTLVILDGKLDDGITVERAYEAALPAIEANPGELNQVWTNLLDNAIDAMEGRGTLRVSARVDGDDVVVTIADTGTGMSTDVQERAFEPFFTTKDVGKGTGLGLDISRRIVVDRHHGAISIESQPGDTVVTVRLPQRPRAAS
jgi:signal transduction histidine kinase